MKVTSSHLCCMFSLPVGVMGAYLTTYFTGLEAHIYSSRIALVMLLGLLAKKAILIVEFAMPAKSSRIWPLLKRHLMWHG